MKFLQLFLLLLTISFAGCGGGEPIVVAQPIDKTRGNLMSLSSAYHQYCTANGKGPASAKELQPLLGKDVDADDTLKSGRDNQPFIVHWGVDLNQDPAWAKSAGVLAYEKQGANGKRWVLFTMGNTEEMSEAELKAAGFPPGKSPAF